MTQKNIDAMDIIVSKMMEGTKLSKALDMVYKKRNVAIPYNEKHLSMPIVQLEMSVRTTNALLREKLTTIGSVVEFCNTRKITSIKNLGRTSGIELFESILDYCWQHMDQDERESFLIDTVERNSKNLRKEI